MLLTNSSEWLKLLELARIAKSCSKRRRLLGSGQTYSWIRDSSSGSPPASPCSYGGPLVPHYLYGRGLILRRKRYFMMYSSYIYPDRVSVSCTNSPRSEIFHRSQANSQLRQNGVWNSRSWNGTVYPGREGESQISESCSLFNRWMLGKVCGKGWIEARFQDRDLPR